MISMRITPEEYAQYFPPAPDYLLVQRMHFEVDKIGRIHVSRKMAEGMVRFITIGKILAISDLKSEEPFVEYMKEQYRKNPYIGFASHVAAEIVVIPQIYFDEDVHLCLIHVKDGAQIPVNFQELLDRHAAFEKEAEEKEKKALQALVEGREEFANNSHLPRAGMLGIVSDKDF